MLLGLLTTGLAFAAAQQAAPSFGLDGNAPIDVSAAKCEVFEAQDRVICAGDVRVTQGDAILSADEMTIDGASSGDGFQRIESVGHVRYAKGINAVSGDKAVYDAGTTTITVTGNVVVVQGEQIMVGGELTYNTTTRAMLFTPGADGRVRGLFHTASEKNGS